MNHDVQLAVIPHIQQSGRAALIAPQRVITIQSEKQPRAESADADQAEVR
jgi:hypothetical protein